MRQWNVRDGLYSCHFQYPQVGLPAVEPIKRIVIGTEEVRHPALPPNGTVEHPTKCGSIDRSRMDAEANDPARVLIHDHQDPVSPQRSRFAPEQIHAPEAVQQIALAFHIQIDKDVVRRILALHYCAIRGEPQLGLRCFISTTARMSSALGPFGPGFRRQSGENSMRYFRLLMAL